MSEIRAAQQEIRRWREEPIHFVRTVLRAEPDDWQAEFLLAAVAGALGRPNVVNPECKRRLALKASKGPGKSTGLAFIGWWFLSCFPFPKGVATSISGDNLRDGLWTELAKWQQQSARLKQMFRWSAERIVSVDHPEQWFLSARQWSRSADPAQQANTLAGIHADNVLVLADESGGIPKGVIAAADAGLANADPTQKRHALLVQAGNPTQMDGPLYDACTVERHLWWVKEISGDPDDPKRASRVSLKWAREVLAQFNNNREHPYVMVNVLGKFPPQGSDKLIGVNEVSDARARVLRDEWFSSDPKVLGVDVARFGDDESVAVIRQGSQGYTPKTWRNLRTTELAGQLAMIINKHDPDAVFIDNGAMGAGVVDQLLVMKYPVIAVDFGGKPFNPRYLNRRAEMWSLMAEWIRSSGSLPPDDILAAELPGPKYWLNNHGQLQLESKEDMKKRGVSSPNRADALALTFAAPVARRGLKVRMPQRSVATYEYDPYSGSR